MIPIVDFCWQSFQSVEISNSSIQELANLAGGPKPFVVIYDRQYHFSALVIPELVTQLVNELDLSPQDSAIATGILDLLRQGQITVSESEPASRVAQLAVKHDIKVVLAVNHDALPVGLFVPHIVTERLPQTLLQQDSVQLQETVGRLTMVDDLPGAIKAIESENSRYRSELLSKQDYVFLVCEDSGKYHVVLQPTCSEHPTAKVRIPT